MNRRLTRATAALLVAFWFCSREAAAQAHIARQYMNLNEAMQAAAAAVAKLNLPPQQQQRVGDRVAVRILSKYYEDDRKHQGLSAQDFQGAIQVSADRVQLWDMRRQAWQDGNLSPEDHAALAALRKKMADDERAILNPGLVQAINTSMPDHFGPQHSDGDDRPAQGTSGDCSGSFAWRCADQRAQRGDTAGALAALNAELARNPDNAAALSARAQVYAGLGMMREANADARSALRFDSKDQAAFAVFQLTEDRVGSQALAAPGQFNAVDPAAGLAAESGVPLGHSAAAPAGFAEVNSAAAIQAAKDAMGVGDLQAAALQLDRALAAGPANPQALALRAAVYARQGDYKAALQDVEAGLRASPHSATLLTTKAFLKNRTKDYRGALEAAGQAREIEPRSADALANYSYALGGLGDRDQMLDRLRDAARMDPRYVKSLASALSMPVDSDILFLFPGETAAAAAPPAGACGGGRGRRYFVLAGAVVLGGLLLALGLLQVAAGPLTARVKKAFTRLPASSGAVQPAALAPRPLPENEKLLCGQYRILRPIGAGGMGMVYEGTDVTLDRPVAIKRMRDEFRLDRRERARFINEAKIVAALHHPNIVDIYAIIEEGDEIFLVFEFVSGKTVSDLIAERGRLGFAEALDICRAAAAALEFAHGRKVIHRDLKPANVMVTAEGFVKVMDFGIARLAQDAATRGAQTNTVAGTPPYMAPEQEQGLVRREGDVYSLALCFYEMVCGQGAFSGTGAGMLMNKVNMAYVPVSVRAAGLPDGVDEVLARALHADPDQRIHSARDLLAALEALPTGAPS